MSRVLITGGQGFIGANLVRCMLREGRTVHLLATEMEPGWRLADVTRDVSWHQADLRDRDAVAEVVRQSRPEWVFHLAAHGAYSWQVDSRKILETNLLGTVNLLEACAAVGVKRFINTGTSSEYGFKLHAPAEDCWLEPNSCYAVGKAAATMHCRYMAQAERLSTVTLRLYSVYGPYEEPRRLMPSLIVHGLSGRYPPLVDPRIARDYVYVDDVLEAYRLAAAYEAHEPGVVYNVGTGVQTTLAEVVACASRVFDLPENPPWGSMPNRGWDTTTWQADSRKIQAVLGWRPRYAIEAGFRKFVDWFSADSGRMSFYEQRLTGEDAIQGRS
jgi:dolichol-phosphate mannosyltransferase